MSTLYRSLRHLAAAGALGLLVACSMLSQVKPVQAYLLPSQSLPTTPTSTVGWSLRLNTPVASQQALNTSFIAVVPEGNQLSAYAGSVWSDPAPRLLRNHLLYAFQNDGRVTALSTDDDYLQADLRLDSELQAFQSEYRNGAVSVLIRLRALLVDSRQRILASQLFEIRQPLQGTDVPTVVNAFGQASDQLAAQVVQWTLLASPPTKKQTEVCFFVGGER